MSSLGGSGASLVFPSWALNERFLIIHVWVLGVEDTNRSTEIARRMLSHFSVFSILFKDFCLDSLTNNNLIEHFKNRCFNTVTHVKTADVMARSTEDGALKMRINDGKT